MLGAKHGEAENGLIISKYLNRVLSGEGSEETGELLASNSNVTANSTNTQTLSTSTTTVPSTTRKTLLSSLSASVNNSKSAVNKASGGLVRLRRQQITVDPICFPKNKSPLPDTFDWRTKGKVTPARFQVVELSI